MLEFLARFHIDQGFTFTEKERRFIQPSNFVSGVAMHCISSTPKCKSMASRSVRTPSQSVTDKFGACAPDRQTTFLRANHNAS